MQQRFLWSPFKWIGTRLRVVGGNAVIIMLFALFIFGVYADLFPGRIPVSIYSYLPVFFSLTGLLLVLRSFAERKDPVMAWLQVIVAQLFITLSIALFHPQFGHMFMLIYLCGSLFCAAAGYYCLRQMKAFDPQLDLNGFHGHVYEHKTRAFAFLVCCLGMIGFPFTPTFIGIDLLFSHIHKQEILLIGFIALSFIFMELALLRIYARVFLGPHKHAYHPVAFRSS